MNKLIRKIIIRTKFYFLNEKQNLEKIFIEKLIQVRIRPHLKSILLIKTNIKNTYSK